MRKALCVGIDSYENFQDLHGCVNDANAVKAVLERNGDGTLNFDVMLMVATSEDSYISRDMLKGAVAELFSDDVDIALFYYSGHGSFDECGGYLCTSEAKQGDGGLALSDLMYYASTSPAKHKIIILDSCHSGYAGAISTMPIYSQLTTGTVILSACGQDQYSVENGEHGVFTSLLTEALYGGATTILGDVTPGSIYAYIDRSLGAWEQRPIFKANISSFVSLRKCSPQISIAELRRITDFFDSPSSEMGLDPTYEPDKHEVENKETNTEHESIFRLLQKYVKLSLVVPVGEEHMYYAAIRSKSCKLTFQGQHYWYLVANERI